MAAYGALVSVMQIIDSLQNHPNPPISIDPEQVESLTQVIKFFQDFLEGYPVHHDHPEDQDIWESRIAESAYYTGDVIESYIVDQIHARSKNDVENISSIQFYQDLQKAIENMNLIKIEIKEKMVVQDQLDIIKSVTTAVVDSPRSTSTATMVGFDDVFLQMLDKIIGGDPDLQIIPIVGMGGIGKTTLARSIYVSTDVQHHFDACAWCTISQEYNVWKILRKILYQVGKKYNRSELSEDELGLHVCKNLFGMRYLIVMDDLWNIEAWDEVRRFFPNNRSGSRIVVTTRLSNLAYELNHSNGLSMKFLDEYASWNLFSKIVFGQQSCPLELEDIGKSIVKGCHGLPLSVVVLGGLLSKSEQTKNSWGLYEKILSSIVTLDNDKSLLQLLYLSYNNLPVHLKPCFLYMGMCDEDEVIRISKSIPLLVAEGFVKPITGKSLEEVAKEYLEELVDRNLLIVEARNHYGKLKSCKMHDLLRDLCLREAQKTKFLCVLGEPRIQQGIDSHLHVESRSWENEYPTPLLHSLESASLVRSFFGKRPKSLSQKFSLLRVSDDFSEEEDRRDYYEEIFLGLVNLRYLVVNVNWNLPEIPSSVSFLWNLQTLNLCSIRRDYVFEIWKMPQLRHVITYGHQPNGAYCLPDPQSDREDMMLENLQTLFEVKNLKFGAEMLKRIPNIKKLKLYYEDISTEGNYYHLNNIRYLHKLETLRLRSLDRFDRNLEVSLPSSLKKLTLERTYLPWEDMYKIIGSLPHLQVLKLKKNSFIGSVWKTFEGQFSNLKFLLIENCDLKYWVTNNTHFPNLEHLVLRHIWWLQEIPSCIGDIPTLQTMKLVNCSDSVEGSTKQLKKLEEFGNKDLHLTILKKSDLLEEEFSSSMYRAITTAVESQKENVAESCVESEPISTSEGHEIKQQTTDEIEEEGIVLGHSKTEMSMSNFGSTHIVATHSSSADDSLPAIESRKENVAESCVESLESGMLNLADRDLHELSSKPDYADSMILFLQRNKRLTLIQPSFFNNMPELHFLDLSDTKIRILPSSLFKLSKLKVLLLRNCICLEKLQPEIGELKKMEVLDLSGTELYDLPVEISQLEHMKRMHLSFYGPDDESEYERLPCHLVSPSFLSEMKEIESLSISVHPEDHRWTEVAACIIKDINKLEMLSSLHFYFPQIKMFENFIKTSPSWNNKKKCLSKFDFTVGQDVKRIVSRVPDEVESMFSQQERCMRYVNGDKTSPLMKSVIIRATAFYLDHHTRVQSLSNFDISSFQSLKFCVVRECPKMQAILDEKNARGAFPCLEYLGIYFMWELRQIWKPPSQASRWNRIFKAPILVKNFEPLKYLMIKTCPKLRFIFWESMLQCLANLEELVVEDCEGVEKIIKEESKNANYQDNVLPRLRKLNLHYLPELVSLGCGVSMSEEKLSVYGCPNWKRA
ncbi:putative late blight resistance protein homolog R1B-16 [Salvia hispanica]|uniref:putative late blight resistance protein homolog R1B-16 n=1 Tax=Salvia hispanica TaxID=49212 RepID=UPI002009146C|nr:putative late blight resistance protein homolog R1B-16 [Salvia hispanica]XP_047957001.1 putative late blight resistance protein homolog R1B-16 [Salvia hispanica]XP_047957002.1 putative late blight resistance protein homolog R1B-16 [Salvia hispanica]XP_047957003.1 putative late blight resistance protein homolog R1B-16 [Salvia hispanica]XP_047957004.1 putative late blight resistance protein homolog R1B-16 [Salvia hispanica]XP_047957005.1 putative late blight resistance protein homolog R1B-16 